VHAGGAGELSPLEQAYVLAAARHGAAAGARDELSHWRAAPYADAVLSQARSCAAAQAAAALARACHEAERPRVRERALRAYQALRDTLEARPAWWLRGG
jgi:hypothetical protein